MKVTNKSLIINRNLIEKTTHQTAADLLDKTGEIFVQKSQLGGGSPMMRFFLQTGFFCLLMESD